VLTASAVQVYLHIYLPLMALALAAIYALLPGRNDYMYQFVLASSTRNMTVSVTQAQLFGDTDASWNAMMAAAILYALPPIAIFFALRRYVAGGLAIAGING
jgi:multiple sugar transport system permease protein